MEWFIKAAKPFKGMNIKVVSETIPTHEYEAKTLAKAFEEITGIKVSHDLIQEGDVIEKLQTQWASGQNIYDAWINDSDLIGTHARYGYVVPLVRFHGRRRQGRDPADPGCGRLHGQVLHHRAGRQALPAAGPAVRQPLLVPLRLVQAGRLQESSSRRSTAMSWACRSTGRPTRTLPSSFTEHVREIDGKAVFGHNDYGKKAPDLGWRFTDAWLSMAGAGDKGIPNGKPVDEWGIRMEGCRPVGATVSRGGAANGPAAKYALRKYMDWLRKYAPPGSLGMDFYTYLPVLANGSVAQQIFWYTAFLPSMVEPGPTVNEDGTPNGAWPPRPMAPTGKRA
jgi:glycerol transport system substrate-binding protein